MAFEQPFEPVSLAHQQAYNALFDRLPVAFSDISFINLWGWGPAHHIEASFTQHAVILKKTDKDSLYWPPVGDWNTMDWELFAADAGNRITMERAPAILVEILRQRLGEKHVSVKEARGQWDYLYSAQELASLSGNKFHKKKNLLNQFLKKYEYRYVPMDESVVNAAKDLQQTWCEWRDCESEETLADENEAIFRILSSWSGIYRIKGGAVFSEDRMVAYTIGENISPDTMLIHFEKADPDYKGSYQAINQMFVQKQSEGRTLVNREQDLGHEGLRKAKMSYNPSGFIEKYEITITV